MDSYDLRILDTITNRKETQMIKPQRKPHEFGFHKNDFHLVVNSDTDEMKAYNYDGKHLWTIPCLSVGQLQDWNKPSGDTPPGLYKIGSIYNDFLKHGYSPKYSRELASYGWASFDMIDLEGNEDNNGRAGIMIHGGGTGLGWLGAWADFQKLLPTLGCIRVHNSDSINKILPLCLKGKVFVSVYQ